MSVTLTVEQGNHTAPSAPHYDVAVSDGAHGSVTVSPKSASKGSTVTVTVTPDKGYALETLTVTDKNGSALDLTDQGGGKYTFTMPSSPVTVAATFMDDNTMLNFFVDVPAGAYYYDAVLWATEGGIVTGTDAVHFSPAASARTTSSRASRSRRCSTASPRRREWTRRRVAWPRASLRFRVRLVLCARGDGLGCQHGCAQGRQQSPPAAGQLHPCPDRDDALPRWAKSERYYII